jgi:hypothetical protein
MIAEAAQDVAVDTSNNVARGTKLQQDLLMLRQELLIKL